MIDPAPSGFDITISVDPSVGTRLQSAHGSNTVFSLTDGSGAMQVELRDGPAARRPAILLPLDMMFELRLDVAMRFVRRLRGKSCRLLPTSLRLTSFQRGRLIQLLHAFDIHDAGGGPRDVAQEVLASDQARLPSVEWKDSHTRRKANRLIHDSIALVERGYLKLLRGG